MDILSPEAVTQLWDRYGPALVLYAQQLCDAPEDVVQEAFLLLVRQRAAPLNPAGWLYRVVRNRAINAGRSSRRQRGRETAAAADRLDGRFRQFLAEEAGLTGEGIDVCPAGHRFICVYCGIDAPKIKRDARRWAWPAAMAGMTTVAAALLVALVVDRAPRTAGDGVGVGCVERTATSEWCVARTLRSPLVSGTDEMCYLRLRDQVLRDGVESWKSPASAVVTAARTTESPLSHREQLRLLLEEQGMRGS